MPRSYDFNRLFLQLLWTYKGIAFQVPRLALLIFAATFVGSAIIRTAGHVGDVYARLPEAVGALEANGGRVRFLTHRVHQHSETHI